LTAILQNAGMKRLAIAAALVALLAPGTHFAAEESQTEMAQEHMRQIFERLELTDEQIDKVKPVLEESAAAQQAILSCYGMDRESRQDSAEKPGLREMRAMRKEMETVRKSTLGELERILSDEQLEEFTSIQEERRAEMKKRLRATQ
jgi:Spy/CpxP family protein refolding chaperone